MKREPTAVQQPSGFSIINPKAAGTLAKRRGLQDAPFVAGLADFGSASIRISRTSCAFSSTRWIAVLRPSSEPYGLLAMHEM